MCGQQVLLGTETGNVYALNSENLTLDDVLVYELVQPQCVHSARNFAQFLLVQSTSRCRRIGGECCRLRAKHTRRRLQQRFDRRVRHRTTRRHQRLQCWTEH